MDKNVVAFVRTDTFTVHVKHGYNGEVPDDSTPTYTYVCNLQNLQIGEVVIVHSRQGLGLAVVVEIDDEVKLEPKADTKSAWVVGRVDMEAIAALQEENALIESQVQQAYAASMRNSYRNQILSGLDASALALLPPSVRDQPQRPAPFAKVDPGTGEILDADDKAD